MIGSGLRPRFLTMLAALCLILFFRPALNLELIYLESPFLNRAGRTSRTAFVTEPKESWSDLQSRRRRWIVARKPG